MLEGPDLREMNSLMDRSAASISRVVDVLCDCVHTLQLLKRQVQAYQEVQLRGQGGKPSGSLAEAYVQAEGPPGSRIYQHQGTDSGNRVSHSPDVLACQPREYHYSSSSSFVSAYGQLGLCPSEERQRNPVAQLAAGGDLRRADDDGGHLIGAMFGGSPTLNLIPQNAQLNRHEGYRKLELQWQRLLEEGYQVYVCVYASSAAEHNRTDAVYGSFTVVTPSGNHITEGFSFSNESSATQDGWDQALQGLDFGVGG